MAIILPILGTPLLAATDLIGSPLSLTPATLAAGVGSVNPDPLPYSQYLKHVTIQGERWDLLAWNYYGDATNYGPIIAANPYVPIVAVFDAGVTLYIPVLTADQASSASANEDLPPWESL